VYDPNQLIHSSRDGESLSRNHHWI